MKPSDCIACRNFPCTDVNHAGYILPGAEVDPSAVQVLLISEAAPTDAADYYYAAGDPAYAQTTLTAFADAGYAFNSLQDLIKGGIYFTTAVKCAKTGYGIQTTTVNTCAVLLAQELALFPNLKAILLMGDVAIKGLNAVAKQAKEPRVITAGSTYKLRGQVYSFRGARVFPSYLQVGPSFNIEKSKRRMIAEDIAEAMKVAGINK